MSIYARIKSFKNKDGSKRDYLYLVESVWDKEKKQCRQRSICCLGRLDKEDVENKPNETKDKDGEIFLVY